MNISKIITIKTLQSRSVYIENNLSIRSANLLVFSFDLLFPFISQQKLPKSVKKFVDFIHTKNIYITTKNSLTQFRLRATKVVEAKKKNNRTDTKAHYDIIMTCKCARN